MTPEQRHAAVRMLERGEELPSEWARILFPPERREYELTYHSKEREEDIIANTLAVPLQPMRAFGQPNSVGADVWQNKLVFGDNLQVLKSLIEGKKNGTLCSADGTPGVRLVYIDPPFATMQEFRGAEDQRAYQDKIAGAAFIEFLRRRLVLLRELMATNSTIYVHLDSKKSHYIKIVMDEIFGEASFAAEIIWQRTNARSTAGTWPRIHDTVLVYSRGTGSPFRAQMVRAQKKVSHTLITWKDGLKYQTYELTAPGKTKEGDSGKKWHDFDPSKYNRHWANDLATREELDANDLIHWPKDGGWPRRRDPLPFVAEEREVMVGDVWTDIDRINQTAKERAGYPTQKPEALLERILQASSGPGDLVLDAFAGSGTTCAVAERTGRRWIGIDCGKFAIYTIQKRLLSLDVTGSKTNKSHQLRPFTLFNAGLYDFSRLKDLPWESWRFFALQLFQCRDQPHEVGGIPLDGYLKGASVLVFNHTTQKGVRISEETVSSLHEALGSLIGNKLFIIAPALTFDFQQDFIDLKGVRYYALRIPYSIINELHHRAFTALKQPSDERSVNDTVDAVGFDFVRTPELRYVCGTARRQDELLLEAFIRITTFKSEAVVREPLVKRDNLETLSVVMLDFKFDESRPGFNMSAVFFAEKLRADDWHVRFPLENIGKKIMAVFIDIYGNEARVVIDRESFGGATQSPKKPASKRPARR